MTTWVSTPALRLLNGLAPRHTALRTLLNGLAPEPVDDAVPPPVTPGGLGAPVGGGRSRGRRRRLDDGVVEVRPPSTPVLPAWVPAPEHEGVAPLEVPRVDELERLRRRRRRREELLVLALAPRRR